MFCASGRKSKKTFVDNQSSLLRENALGYQHSAKHKKLPDNLHIGKKPLSLTSNGFDMSCHKVLCEHCRTRNIPNGMELEIKFCDSCLRSNTKFETRSSLEKLERYYCLINDVCVKDDENFMEYNSAKEIKETTYFVGHGAYKICIGKTDQIAILYTTDDEKFNEVRFFTESFKNIKVHTLHASIAGITAMEDDNFAVTAANEIIVFSPRGNKLRNITMDTCIKTACGIALYDSGFLILDMKSQDVHFICEKGKWRDCINASNTGYDKLKTPHSITTNVKRDNIIITDGTSVKVYNTSKKTLLHQFLTKDSQFEGLCVDSCDNIIVSNNAFGKVSLLNSTAKFSRHLVAGLSNTSDIAVNSHQHILVLQKEAGMITIYTYDANHNQI